MGCSADLMIKRASFRGRAVLAAMREVFSDDRQGNGQVREKGMLLLANTAGITEIDRETLVYI